jgi:hypothetical protein
LGAKALGEAAVYFLDMVQISISPATFAAIAETMPLGSIGFENARAPNGDRFIWLPRDVLEKLNQWRAPGEGIVMSGCRPLIKGFFGVARVVGAVMSSAFFCGELDPLALMLSADPLPRSRQRA